MIGKRIFCFLVLGVLFLLGCQGKRSGDQGVKSAEEPVEAAPSDEPNELLSVEDYIARHYPEYAILKAIPSNLLPDIEEESLVVLEDPIMSETFDPPNYSIDEVLCVYVADGRTQKHVLVGAGSIGYREEALRLILSYESLYGPWLDYCYLPDVDGDGIQEAVIFDLSGFYFRMGIWKFQDGEFQLIDDEDLTASY